MKRHGNLWSQITSFDNLILAAKKAKQGKTFYPNVMRFNANLEEELIKLQQELITQSYYPGNYTAFYIYEPKPRLISASPYRDRVIHHALCNVIGPLLEKSFIHDSYANRVGFGTHRALKRITQFARSSRYVFQADIKKYFPTIDHEILKSIIRSKIKCKPTLELIDIIINHSNPQETVIDYFSGDDLLTPLERRKGLPLGNLTSQFFANLYLNNFDHFVKEQLKVKKYLRYVDDFALFDDNKEFLVDSRSKIENYLDQLRLKIHPLKSQIFETQQGVSFVGFRVLPDRIRVRNDNLKRSRKRLKLMQKDFAEGKISLSKIVERLQSWESHLKHGDTYYLRKSIFDYWIFCKNK